MSEFSSSESSDSLQDFKSKLTELSDRFCSGCSLSGSFLNNFLLGDSSSSDWYSSVSSSPSDSLVSSSWTALKRKTIRMLILRILRNIGFHIGLILGPFSVGSVRGAPVGCNVATMYWIVVCFYRQTSMFCYHACVICLRNIRQFWSDHKSSLLLLTS